MVLNLGIIGTGAIGRDHIERISTVIQGAKITGVFDILADAANKAVADFKLDATVFSSEEELIASKNVDAILVCSKNDTHFSPIMKAIEAGKCVFTEKPMTTTEAESEQIIDTEVAKKHRFVQVGFMRRYDPGYQALKKVIDAGEIGLPLLGNCRHYCAKAPTNYFTTEMVVNDSFIHEIDILHYLFNEDYQSIEMKFARPNTLNPAKKLRDPQLAIVTMKSGAIITVELNLNSQYGYDIQCRIVGETGSVSLPEVQSTEIRKNGEITYPIHKDWSLRFVEAYNREIQAFVDQVTRFNTPAMPTAWDGYIAAVASDAAIRSQKEEKAIPVELKKIPTIYQN
ncbi:Gfo/Idh/MocA family protein [Enterococcus sp. OL5]|uniref:Gfo/Idh/MocA family protein n=1 Tax=Enterococcus sp. OL5 TaxID=2590214 RepID=UPI001129C3DD|nr:Gfo/Idh/MocA family oxidoreductase [Enterococcus sp. OL5]TPR55434.1 Gfo/Idh/MocA family oxidoreductase [Enterococcus sp. OL5]